MRWSVADKLDGNTLTDQDLSEIKWVIRRFITNLIETFRVVFLKLFLRCGRAEFIYFHAGVLMIFHCFVVQAEVSVDRHLSVYAKERLSVVHSVHQLIAGYHVHSLRRVPSVQKRLRIGHGGLTEAVAELPCRFKIVCSEEGLQRTVIHHRHVIVGIP